MIIKITRTEFGRGLPLPSYQTDGAAGMDLLASIPDEIVLKPGDRALVPAGFKMAVPEGFEAQIRPRSGMALKQGVTVLNAPGTIDSDYRGEVGVILINLGQEAVSIRRGERIAQMVLAPVARTSGLVEVDTLDETERGEGGFGSTGAADTPRRRTKPEADPEAKSTKTGVKPVAKT